MQAQISRRTMLKLTSGSGVALLLAACAPAVPAAAPDTAEGADQAAVEVEMMYQANELSDAEIDQFNEAYAPVSLIRTDFDFTRYFSQYAAGDPPDLIRTQANDIPQLRARDLLLNLQPFFDASDMLDQDDLVPINDYYKVTDPLDVGKGDLFGMAKDWAPDAFLWVNDTVLETAGITPPAMDDLLSAEEVVELAVGATTRDGNQYVTTGFNGHTGFIDRYWMSMIKSAGGSLFRDDFSGIELEGNAAALDAINFFHGMAEQGAMNSALNPSPAWFGPDFVAGRLAMVYTGYWFHGFAVGDPDETFQQAVADGKIHMYPCFTWKGERHNRCITATGAICSRVTKDPDAAWKVFEWYMAEEPALTRAQTGWGLPALNSLWDLIPKEGSLSAGAWESIQVELPFAGDVLGFNPFMAGGEPMIPGQMYLQNQEQVLNGTMTLEDLLRTIETETNLAIEEGMERISG